MGARGCRSCTGSGARRTWTESTLDHLNGYEGATPVRIGNAAFNQRQNDVYGALLDSVYIHAKVQDHLPHELWEALCRQVESAIAVWQKPDQGIWEARGEPKHYVSSKLMCWVALDRGCRLADRIGDEDRLKRWTEIAAEIRTDILEKGVSERGVFRQHYETDALDASTLLVPLVRFLPPSDERVVNTVKAITEDLTEDGLVLRYRVDETDDGLHGEEASFLICSFWLVSALSEIGERQLAREMCERLLSVAGPLGPLRRGARREDRAPLGQLPPGVHAPGADQRRQPRDLRRPLNGRPGDDRRAQRDDRPAVELAAARDRDWG